MSIEEIQTKVDHIRRKIVEAQTAGEDITKLQREFREAKLDLEVAKETIELEKLAERRKLWQKKAAKIQEGVSMQREAIGKFLAESHSLADQLRPLLEKVRALPAMQQRCYEHYPDIGMFSAMTAEVSAEFLPENLSCPSLTMGQAPVPAREMAQEAYMHLQSCIGILAAFNSSEMSPTKCLIDEGLGLFPPDMSLDEIEDDTEGENHSCIVCADGNKNFIDKDLKVGIPLRELEAKYGISRSSLHRHKQAHLRQIDQVITNS